jgi:glycosyltransferase involved in cell wall biosynthesis
MRHAAITFARDVTSRLAHGESWDLLFCSDMLNLAEFLGLVDPRVRRFPSVTYFHENQLTYPDRRPKERDRHFALTNLTSCLAADQVWFNSEYHRGVFLKTMGEFVRRMPDFRPAGSVEVIARKSHVYSPGIDVPPPRSKRPPGPMRLLWAARWEHDKGPKEFFEAVKQLNENGKPFRLNVIGERFHDVPEVFRWAHDCFRDEIDRWGWQESREEYFAALQESDVIVSTAEHEFFGLSVMEAIAAGAYPLLPERLTYPEILDLANDKTAQGFFYDGTTQDLTARLVALAERIERSSLWQDRPDRLRRQVERFFWSSVVEPMDDALEKTR